MNNKLEIWPSISFLIVLFNLCGLFFKDKLFFNWWIVFVIVVGEYILSLLIFNVYNKILKNMREN